jgi:hypothetical protein
VTAVVGSDEAHPGVAAAVIIRTATSNARRRTTTLAI